MVDHDPTTEEPSRLPEIRSPTSSQTELDGIEAGAPSLHENLPSGVLGRSLLEVLGVGVAILDTEGSILESNPCLLDMLECDHEDLAGRCLLDFTLSPTMEADRAIFKEVVRGARSGLLLERRFQNRGGRSLWGRLSLSSIEDAEGRIRYNVATLENVTARHQVEERLTEHLNSGLKQVQESRVRLEEEEAARRAAESACTRIESVLERITDSFFALDRNWRFTYVNRHAAEQLRHPATQLLGRNIWEVLPKSIGSTIHRELFRALREGTPVGFELLEPESGHWIDARAFPSESGLSVYFRDVTSRKLSHQREERLASVIDLTPDFVGVADDKGKLVFLNLAGRKMIGFGADEEISDHSLFDLHPPWAARLVLEEAVPTAIRSGVWEGESAALTRAGEEIPIAQVLMARLDRNGKVDTYSTIWRDITQQKAAERMKNFQAEAGRTLAASLELDDVLEALPRFAINVLGDFCVVVFREGDQVRQVAEAHKDPEGEALLRELRRFRAAAPKTVGMLSVLASGQPELVSEVSPVWLQAAARSREHLRIMSRLNPRSMIIVPLQARGLILGALACGVVDSDRRYGPSDLTLAQGLATVAAFSIGNARLYREARKAAHLRDEVLGVVSHDLRSPLSIIAVAAERLHRKAAEEKRDEECKNLEVILNAGRRANRLVDDLLDIARLRSSQLVACPVPTPPSTLVRDATEAHRELAQAKSIDLTCDTAPDLPDVLADPGRIPQVFGNLLGNAIKFTPHGGRIEVRAAAVEDCVRFAVRDSGPGIDQKDLDHVFDAFWQARRTGRESSGLGLAIVKGIVEAHGGEVSAKSAPGAGSTFCFTLPMATERSRSGGTSPPRSR